MGKEKPATKKKCFVRMDMIIQQLEEASGYHKGEFESKRHRSSEEYPMPLERR